MKKFNVATHAPERVVRFVGARSADKLRGKKTAP
jgi:hypothetical protein